MGINNLSDEQIKEMVEDPRKFLANKQNQKQIYGLDSATKRRTADIMKYNTGLSKADVKTKLNKYAAIFSKSVDQF